MAAAAQRTRQAGLIDGGKICLALRRENYPVASKFLWSLWLIRMQTSYHVSAGTHGAAVALKLLQLDSAGGVRPFLFITICRLAGCQLGSAYSGLQPQLMKHF